MKKNKQMHLYIKYIRDGTRAHEIRLVSQEREDILPKHFAVFKLELHHKS